MLRVRNGASIPSRAAIERSIVGTADRIAAEGKKPTRDFCAKLVQCPLRAKAAIGKWPIYLIRTDDEGLICRKFIGNELGWPLADQNEVL